MGKKLQIQVARKSFQSTKVSKNAVDEVCISDKQNFITIGFQCTQSGKK